MVWVQERSFVALGATSATFRVLTFWDNEFVRGEVIAADALLAAVAIAMPTTTDTTANLAAVWLLTKVPFCWFFEPRVVSNLSLSGTTAATYAAQVAASQETRQAANQT